jgi:ABC-type dipeptide/oligopeptide/nickel transport system permease subunit
MAPEPGIRADPTATATPGTALLASRRRSDSPARLAWRRFLRHRFAVIGSTLLVALVLAAIFAPHLVGVDPVKTNLRAKLSAPSATHWFGTDHFGRDMFSRLLHGARVSLTVGMAVVLIAATIGTPLGLVAGFFGGRIDNLIMRVMDAFLTFPPLLLAIAIMGTLGPETQNIVLALGLVYIPVFARLVRGDTLSLRERDYVTASAALGASSLRSLLKDILPNVFAVVLVQAAITFSRTVLAEASLSFLGLGVQPPTPSWGRDLNEARRFLATAWWLVVVPTAMIGVSVLSMNFVGDGLRDALDPRSG